MNGSVENKETKECPYCAETILKKAKVCKYCEKSIEMMECPHCAEEVLKTSEVCEFCGIALMQPEKKNDQPGSQSEDVFLLKNQSIAKKGTVLKWLFAVVIFLVIVVGYKVYKEVEDNNDCELAKSLDTKAKWGEYIEKHADGKCVLLAGSRIKEKIKDEEDKKSCESAQSQNTKEAWKSYIRNFPDGKCVQEGEERINFIEEEERRIAEKRRIAEEQRKKTELTKYQVAVQVADKKSNGDSWDDFGAPDIEICWSDGDTRQCSPKQCHDSFSCIFNIVLSSEKVYEFTVIDSDWLGKDLIGSGFCAINTSCDIGQATILIN